MKKVFIDCGSHDGCSVRKFMDLYDDGQYQYYCFEINNKLDKFYDDIRDKITLIYKGVDTQNKISKMLRMGLTGGSTLDLNKKETLHNKQFTRKDCLLFDFDQSCKAASLHEEEVETINLSKWIMDTFSSEDYLVLKMDIEGIEYKIIDHMVQNEVFKIIDELKIEFHMTNKFNIYDYINKIKQQNKNIIIDMKWDAMHPPYLVNKYSEEFYKTNIRQKVKFRKPLNHKEKIYFLKKFITDNELDYKLIENDNFVSFKKFLNKLELVENWKQYIFKVGTGEIK